MHRTHLSLDAQGRAGNAQANEPGYAQFLPRAVHSLLDRVRGVHRGAGGLAAVGALPRATRVPPGRTDRVGCHTRRAGPRMFAVSLPVLVRDSGPTRSYDVTREHKNGGPAWTRRFMIPLL